MLRGNPGSTVAHRYQAAVGRLSEASIAMSVKSSPATALGSVAVESGLVLIILLGAGLYIAGTIPAFTLLLFLFLSLAIYQPIQELNSLVGYRRNQQQITAKLAEVWDAPVLPEPAEPETTNDSSVEFQQVNFRYDGAPESALNGVSFRAESGEITALVGPSGSGKSTIAHLVSRLWDPDSGAVRIGGADVRQLGTQNVMDLVATMYQEVYLFDATVRFNVSLGRPGATDAEIWTALEAAQCDDVVAGLPEGLDTELNDGGTDLSGGQRQRLAIARALLKDSPILILDEAVAAVDPATEERIQKAITRLAAGRTLLIIAHRLSTVRQSDRIVVVSQGHVEGSGTHTELMGSSQTYQQLAQTQGLTSAPIA